MRSGFFFYIFKACFELERMGIVACLKTMHHEFVKAVSISERLMYAFYGDVCIEKEVGPMFILPVHATLFP